MLYNINNNKKIFDLLVKQNKNQIFSNQIQIFTVHEILIMKLNKKRKT